jgi:hypothetical protein
VVKPPLQGISFVWKVPSIYSIRIGRGPSYHQGHGYRAIEIFRTGKDETTAAQKLDIADQFPIYAGTSRSFNFSIKLRKDVDAFDLGYSLHGSDGINPTDIFGSIYIEIIRMPGIRGHQ